MMQHSPAMDEAPRGLPRRRLLQLGLGAGALLAVGGGLAWLWRPGWRDGRLTASGRAIFAAVARVVLEGSLSNEPAAVARHLAALDATLAGLSPAARAELSQLLGLLSVAAGRQWLAGLAVDWPEASVIEIEAALRRMRLADSALRQQAYHALRDLSNAAFYAEPAHWPLLGYPGPTPIA